MGLLIGVFKIRNHHGLLAGEQEEVEEVVKSGELLSYYETWCVVVSSAENHCLESG
jgi:hypothetical protein